MGDHKPALRLILLLVKRLNPPQNLQYIFHDRYGVHQDRISQFGGNIAGAAHGSSNLQAPISIVQYPNDWQEEHTRVSTLLPQVQYLLRYNDFWF